MLSFLVHRAVRIYPPFWLVFLAVLPIALVMSSRLQTPVDASWSSLLIGFLLVPQIEPPVIGVAWTLHHELLFYGLAGLWIRFPLLASAMGLMLLLGSCLKVDGFAAQFLLSPFHWEFAAGLAAACLAPRTQIRYSGVWVCLSAALGIATCFGLSAQNAYHSSPVRFLLLAPLFALLIGVSVIWEDATHGFRQKFSTSPVPFRFVSFRRLVIPVIRCISGMSLSSRR